MIHNESVNIWSHCLPALIICIFAFSFFMMVDHKQFGDDLNYYKNQISESFSQYTQTLDNLTQTSGLV
jgi:predicted membrane channel-forming protein YqfA (hemolysin III family)